MSDRVLFVDDDANILAAYKRTVHKLFAVETANGADEGIAACQSRGPYAVVVSDMRMPGTDGIGFLRRVGELAPDTVRMMLTGFADLQTAMDPVNQGQVFRLLTKPCPGDVLIQALVQGVRQYQLVTSERELLEQTLNGAVKVLSEVLSVVNPEAFSRTSRIARHAKLVGERLAFPEPWQLSLAALLSQVGCVSRPAEVIRKAEAMEPLSEDEREMLAHHPDLAARLLARIPRLDQVAQMVGSQLRPYWEYENPLPGVPSGTIALGAQILRLATDLDLLLARGYPPSSAVAVLADNPRAYNPAVLKAIGAIITVRDEAPVRSLGFRELREGMIAHDAIYSRAGLLLLPRGGEITEPVIERLRNFATTVGLREPLLVHAPPEASS
jgi:response regulator RpfG family c-di-GMP phosphodiesterase